MPKKIGNSAPLPSACSNTEATTTPSSATATNPATRATALLTPDATPVSPSSTDVITAVDSGETTKPMPSPSKAADGNTAVQAACIGAVSPMTTNARATISDPSAISGPGPYRSAHL